MQYLISWSQLYINIYKKLKIIPRYYIITLRQTSKSLNMMFEHENGFEVNIFLRDTFGSPATSCLFSEKCDLRSL